MILSIRRSKVTKVVAVYLSASLLFQLTDPVQLFALTSGPTQPEFNNFTPIGSTEMVDLSSGRFSYNIPIMDVGGYPINLSYTSGTTVDQEASWTGLNWNLNVGQINRQVRGLPDDFRGDEMVYENNLRPNVTVGINAKFDPQAYGLEATDQTGGALSLGLGIKYNNYHGLGFSPSYGLSYDMSKLLPAKVLPQPLTGSLNVQTSAMDGVSISPNLNAKIGFGEKINKYISGGLNAGLSYNSMRGLSSFNLGASLKPAQFKYEGVSQYSLAGSSRLSFHSPSLTPRKRTAFKDINTTFSFSTGADIFGFDGELELSASLSVQKIKDEVKKEKAYGYEHTGKAGTGDILDYNRENDRLINEQLQALPYTNYTYDLYNVQAQGVGGQFRSYRGKVGQVYDEFVQDQSQDFTAGIEVEPGSGVHFGANFVASPSQSHTGIWQTTASPVFENENEELIDKDYEPVYFKYVGERRVDDERELYTDALKGKQAIDIKLGGSTFDKYASRNFRVKQYNPVSNAVSYIEEPFSDNEFKRSKREIRNQAIQKFTVDEMKQVYTNPQYVNKRVSKYAAGHHTAEMRVLKPDGVTYVFGEAAYNVEKHEVAFATDAQGNNKTGIIKYNEGENTNVNSSGLDHFYNRVITPAYAHTYLLTSVLSADYEDKTGNGPTNDDLGAFTLFEYHEKGEEPFKWRVPYGRLEASYNAGLNTNKRDQKGSYLYGEKEVKYLKKISTKTHVALFSISKRNDGRGVVDENGGGGATAGYLYKLDEIKLYSRPEYIHFASRLEDDDPDNDPTIEELSPIKTAFFKYDYELCTGVPNNPTGEGKLTLKKVYFTYRNSKMGKHTPYEFEYDANNPGYNLKSYDIWGNYSPNVTNSTWSIDAPNSKAEFPFVDQENKAAQDEYVKSWSLNKIKLPSGGAIEIDYESNDYQFVQDKKVMAMYKVIGAGNDALPGDVNTLNNDLLYKFNAGGDAKYLYVNLPQETDAINPDEFNKKYLNGKTDKPIYFRFLLNMTKKGATLTSRTDFDYVTGYFDSHEPVQTFKLNDQVYASIPMKQLDMEGGIEGDKQVNPISKAGWYFGRNHLNGIVYGLNQDYQSENVKTIAKKLFKSIQAIVEIFTGPNGKLRSNEHLCAQRFVSGKSWIRLGLPGGRKLGGGQRVKSVRVYDAWDIMTDSGIGQQYGQDYFYMLEDSTSSGVATFEPNDCAENPFVEPFYNKGERLLAPRETNYIEKPFGKAFFPGSKVTYSRVMVRNMKREGIRKHATGKVVSHFFTSKDYPTQVDYTDVQNKYSSNENKVLQNIISGLLSLPIRTRNEFALSQGYVIHTNDMDGKMKKQEVYQENLNRPISTSEYKYSTIEGDESTLNNVVPVIHKNGQVRRDQEIGVDYDVVTDFRESYSKLENKGLNTNVVTFSFPPFLTVPTAFITNIEIENIAHSVITTKVIHTSGILKEVVSTDLGAKVSTLNQAWDAQTGEVLLTKTVNEYDDNYYSFNFPAYWAYPTQGAATTNLNLRGTLSFSGDYFTYPNASKYLALGDELIGYYGEGKAARFWVVEKQPLGDGVLLMNKDGAVINKGELTISEDIDFKIVRSGYRNMQLANMASITMMKNPLKNTNGTDVNVLTTSSFEQAEGLPVENRLKIINANAISYSDFWNCQCEYELPFIPYKDNSSDELVDLPIEEYMFNPYIFNVKGDWKPKKSFAYLTERVDATQGGYYKRNNRKEGYYKEFAPFYALNNSSGSWEVNGQSHGANDWTFASEVTKYSPFGVELENRDVLNRFSSAQYGYNFTLPVAVSSNSAYRQMGNDNFEDYHFLNTDKAHFSFKEQEVEDGEYGIAISTDQAHTGFQSLLVPNGDAAIKEIELIGVEAVDDDFDGDGILNLYDKCPYTFNHYGSQVDYDDDEIGDVCDDNGRPEVSNIMIAGQMHGCRNHMKLTVNGTPNSTGYVKIHVTSIPTRKNRKNPGWDIYLDDVRLGGKDDNPDGMVVEVKFDATGRYFPQLELRVQRKRIRQSHRRNLDVTLEIQDMHHNPVASESIRAVSYKTRGCHGEPWSTHALFPTQ